MVFIFLTVGRISTELVIIIQVLCIEMLFSFLCLFERLEQTGEIWYMHNEQKHGRKIRRENLSQIDV